jgi:hypothetical protein
MLRAMHATYTKTASVLPAEDGRLTPEICRGIKTQKSDCESEIVLSWLR